MNRGQAVILDFINQLNKFRNNNFKIVSWPDEVNRTTKDIDALVEDKQQKIAIEHTSIDILPNQREDDSIYFQVVKGLTDELSKLLKFRITIIIQSYSIKKGQSYRLLRDQFKEWLIFNVPKLPYGNHKILDTELPFVFEVKKEKLGKNKIAIGRDVPFDDTFLNRLTLILNEKYKKIKKYEEYGYRTFILVENSDIQLMSSFKIFDAIHDNNSTFEKKSVDEIWFADTSIENNFEYWLLNDRNLKEKINWPSLLH